MALVAFAVGAFVGARLIRTVWSNRARVPFLALALQVLLVAAAFLTAELHGSPVGAGTRYALLSLLGLGMGVQNAAARALAVPDLTTTVLTLTITGTAADSRLAGGTGSKAGRRLLSIAAMFLGGLIGALLVLNARVSLPLLLAAVLLAVACGIAWRLTRSSAPWTRPL